MNRKTLPSVIVRCFRCEKEIDLTNNDGLEHIIETTPLKNGKSLWRYFCSTKCYKKYKERTQREQH